jgi:hypothetical protein
MTLYNSTSYKTGSDYSRVIEQILLLTRVTLNKQTPPVDLLGIYLHVFLSHQPLHSNKREYPWDPLYPQS